jgi:hypothetical protein
MGSIKIISRAVVLPRSMAANCELTGCRARGWLLSMCTEFGQRGK